MNIEEEDQLLQSAISKGFISIDELDRLAASVPDHTNQIRWGARVDRLVESGTLKEAVVLNLAHRPDPCAASRAQRSKDSG
jgi:hypothetical protein